MDTTASSPKPRSRWGTLPLLACLFAALLAPTDAGADTPPPTMTGEELLASGVFVVGSPYGCIGIGGGFEPVCPEGEGPYTLEITETQCNDDGSGSFTYRASGPATGPYPGTFTETGSLAFGPTDPASPFAYSSPITNFSATFRIDSTTGVVEGSKSLTDQPASVTNRFAGCRTSGGVVADQDAIIRDALYEARITTTDGTYTDTGRAAVRISADARPRPADAPYGYFAETYLSNLVTPVPEDRPAVPGHVSLTPIAATNPVGTTHTVTATVTTTANEPLGGVTTLFTVRGSTHTAGACVTASDGSCSFTYQGPDLPGADSITACADSNSDGLCAVTEPYGEATKAWVLPTSTPGHITGGGQIPDLDDANRKVAFGFTAQDAKDGFKGQCSVVDQSPARNLLIKCLDVTALVRSGTHATFWGNATLNGSPTTYRIDVDDLSEPGKGRDTFKIRTDSGYLAAGVLGQGNIQIH